MKIVITTSSFATYDRSPLDELARHDIDYALNPFGRKLTATEVVDFAKNADGILAGTERLDEQVLEQLPNLKVISRCGAGIDNVDLKKAKELDIKVLSTPYGPTLAVAELTLGLILDLLRKITKMDREMRSGIWKKQMGNLLCGKKVGIMGFGRIGKKVADLLTPLGTEIYYHDIQPKEHAIPYMPKEELLAWADIITLHCTANENGAPIIDHYELQCMKDHSWLINVSRGGLIDEKALYVALQNGKLAGAAIDAFVEEPYKGPLADCDRIILTPHIGSYAKEGRIQMEFDAASNLIAGLQK